MQCILVLPVQCDKVHVETRLFLKFVSEPVRLSTGTFDTRFLGLYYLYGIKFDRGFI